MPRPKKEGAPEPKKRSRTGCWPCKARKVKCGEEKPKCLNCERQGEVCDYSIRLNWGGRSKKDSGEWNVSSLHSGSPHSPFFPTPEALGIRTVSSPTPSATHSESDVGPAGHWRKRSNLSVPPEERLVPLPDPNISPRGNGPTSAPTNGSFKQELGTLDSGALLLENFRRQHGLESSLDHRDITSAPIDPRIESIGLRASPSFMPDNFSLRSPAHFDNNGETLDRSGTPSSASLPPFSSISGQHSPYEPALHDSSDHGEHQTKRMRFSPNNNSSTSAKSLPTAVEDSMLHGNNSSSTHHNGNFAFNLAPTSATPSSGAGNSVLQAPLPPAIAQNQEEPRRLSVQDLLSEPPPDDPLTPQTPESWQSHDDTTAYGYDLGKADEDIPKNDDNDAIRVIGSPEAKRLIFPAPAGPSNWRGSGIPPDKESKAKPIAFNRGGYYAKPVAIRIPKSLEPLPSKLMANPMNLLYFHHFLNHTARILVPHDCEHNPFRKILPQLAVQDENVLNLMLAYSASHRARLLCHKEPSNRIAEYVQDVFPKLRQALTNASEQVSTTNLASAIMLASLEIMSPNTFEVPISWQNHLTIARNIVSARGGASRVNPEDKVSSFLSRWFAYLDVIGSLSGTKNDWPLSSTYWYNEDDSTEDEFQIDCLLGFTTRCVGILARIAELAKFCEKERIDSHGNVNSSWRPSAATVGRAEALKLELQESRGHVSKTCNHRRANTTEQDRAWDLIEIYATNEAFHWAGLIHLTRRILGRPSADPEVQNAVREIVGALYKVRRSSTAEACLLFPMFTAGCDAQNQAHRDKILRTLKSVEGFGMSHVKKARMLMEKVWDTGKPWESLVSDEFFG